jgi:hypothetical protein
MKTAKQFLVVSAAFVMAVVTFSVVAPKAAHAVIATLVQVTNTSSNPVIADAEIAARHRVRLIKFGQGDSFGGPLNDVSTSSPFVVPAGQRLVLEQVSLFSNPGINNTSTAWLYVGTYITLAPVATRPGEGTVQVLTKAYVDPGGAVFFSIESTGTGATQNGWTVSASGYLVDCNGFC